MNTPSASLVLRLSELDRQFILSGLSWIAFNCQLWVNRRQLPNSRPDRGWAQGLDKGTFDQNFMDGVVALHAKASTLKPGGRLRVATSFGFAACALAVRVAVTRDRHGHTRIDAARIDDSSKRLLRRLELARKRAKSSEIRHLGQNVFAIKSRLWQLFVRWLRVHFLDCSCRRKRRHHTSRSRRVLVRQLVGWARAELVDRNERVPPDAELRRLVRLNLRYIRRGRTHFGVRDLLNDRVFAAARLANFVTIRMEKARNRRPS